MKNLKRVRRGVRVFVPKAFNLLVILGLVFQPVGPAGLASVAWAIDETPVAASEAPAVSDTKDEPKSAPAEEPKKEEAPAPAPKEAVPPVEKPADPVADEPAVVVVDETPAVTPAEEPVVEPATPVEEPALPADDTKDEAGTSQEPVVVTPDPVEAPVVDEDTDRQECLSDGADAKASSADDWTVDGDKAVTKGAVKLGVTYEYPLDKDVRVTFTCLPKDEGERAPLSIERIKAADIDLPEGVEAASEYAYDITTDGMDNGGFKYDLVLPKDDGIDGAKVAYIEKSADEVKGKDLAESDVKDVDEKDVDEKSDSVEVADLDHFTIYVATYESNFSTLKDEYYQGETVFVKAGGFNTSRYYRLVIDKPTGTDEELKSCFKPSDSTVTASYKLPSNATVNPNWYAKLKEYDSDDSNCNDNIKKTESDKFAVLAAKPDLKAEKSHNPDQEVVVGQAFTWKIHVSNTGTGAAVFGDGKKILLDELSEDATYGVPSVANLAGVTGGTIDCAIDDEELVCEADGAVTIAAGGSFDVSFAATPTEAKTLENPRHGGTCAVDPIDDNHDNYRGNSDHRDDAVDESNENNNKCSDSVKVKEVPYEPTMICHATHSDSNPFNSITPNTIGVLMGHVGTGAGNDHQNNEDIIPPVPYYLPLGQNWDAEGQAIWESDCEVLGGLKVIKTVDDQSDLTKWSFQLDADKSGPTFQANAQGQVDFGSVATGTHTITEIGPNAYTVSVTGTGCTPLGSLAATAVVSRGETTTCNFSNQVNKGTITVIKEAAPESAQSFSFSGSLGNFSLVDDGTAANTKVSDPLFPGSYSVSEGVTSGWALSGISCVSDKQSVGNRDGNSVYLDVEPGANIVCTFTNTKNPVCGDGIKNGAEQCDGKEGVTEGTFCTNTCQLVPVYQGGSACSEGMIPVKEGEYEIGAKDADGVAVSLVGGQEYLFQASGTYNYDKNNSGKYADAAYGTNTNWSSTRGDIGIWGTNRGVTSILGNLGSGVGVIEWDDNTSADGDHTYQRSFTPSSGLSARFLISDWHDDWYGNACDNQNCMNDNAGSLKLEVFKCMAEPDVEITKTDTPDPVTSGGILTYTLTAKNNGLIAATDVVVTDMLPAQFDLTNVSPSVGSCSDAEDAIDKDIRCEIGTLAAGASATVTVKGVALGTGVISNTAEVTGGNGDSNEENNSDTEETKVNEVGDGVCRNNTVWASSVTGFSQGLRKDSSAVLPARSIPASVLGMPNATTNPDSGFYSLGKGGSITVGFSESVVDVTGDDLSFHEVTNNRSSYPLEKVKVEVSADGSDWRTLGVEATSEPSGDGTTYLDFGATGLSSISYVRITDTTNFGLNGDATADGYDIDAIDARCGSGTVIVEKQTTPSGSQQSFAFDPSWSDEGFSLADDQKASFKLASGTYSVAEAMPLPAGWAQTGVSCVSDKKDKESADSISLQPGETVTCVFTNTQDVTVVASKIICDKESDLPNRHNGPDITATTAANYVAAHPSCRLVPDWKFQWGYNGVTNPGDEYVGEAGNGWTTFGPTGSDGTASVSISDPDGGRLKFREVLQEGYLPFTYKTHGNTNVDNVTAEFYCANDVVNYDNEEWINAPRAGQTYYCVAWNVPLGSVHGQKWHDRNGNGVKDGEEELLSGWTIFIDKDKDGVLDDGEPNMVTSDEGEHYGWYWFEDLLPGEYQICEVGQKGWMQTYPAANACHTVMLPNDEPETVNAVIAPEYHFGNFQTGKISGYKWDDCNGNGRWDEENQEPEENTFSLNRIFEDNESDGDGEDSCSETGKSGVTVYLDLNHDGERDENEPSDVTDESGYYEFSGLAAGNYSVQEVVPEGWQQTSNVCAGYVEKGDDEYDGDFARKSERPKSDGVDIVSGSVRDWCDIGNMETPSLSIEKENDVVGPMQPGATVHYRIKVKAHHNDVKGVEVTDLPPKGFAYVPGSGTGAPFIHEYASPGIWDLGNMVAGQEITLEYDAVIATDQDPGDYKDLAYAVGSSEAGENDVIADDLMESDNFVGTRVAVVVPEDPAIVTVPEDNENKIKEKTKKKTQYVLGASTLPMTGGGAGSAAAGAALFLVGAGLVALSRRKKLSFTLGGRTIALSLVGLVSLMGAGTADAASLAVQMEEPEAVVSSPDFKIGFVTLDILGRDISVECYRNGFVFDTQSLSAGGNSGDCQVDAAVMPADGDYEFYVKAMTSDEGGDTAESAHYTVKLVTTVPGTPYDYDRDDASCMNNIAFHTAADGGKTVKVELYRSASTSFTADASTKVAEQMIGSDAVGGFSVAAPGCSNDSYYAIRAVDTYGNASAFVGDKDRNVDTHTVTKTKTTVVETAAPAVGAIPVSAGDNEGAEGQVEGASTVTEDEAGADKAGSVLGDATVLEEAGSWMGEHPWRTAFWIAVIIALIAYAYRQWRNGKQD